ncbi:MAG: hypothetical protein ACREET_08490 [Stellaceae bacterium]
MAEQFRLPALTEDGFLVQSGSPARYLLSAEPNLLRGISAITVLARRHVPLIVAKRAIEAVLDRKEAVFDVPMVEDRAAFERELAELGVRSSRCEPELQNAAK